MLGHKGVPSLLCEWHEGHPNLLPAFSDEHPTEPLPAPWVRKPPFAREDADIERAIRWRTPAQQWSIWRCADDPAGLHPLPKRHGDRQLPAGRQRVIADRPADISIREDASRITGDTSRFVRHAIVGD